MQGGGVAGSCGDRVPQLESQGAQSSELCVWIGKEWAGRGPGSRWAESDAADKATNPGLVFLNCAWVGSGGGDWRGGFS